MRVKSGSFIPFSVPMTILMWEASKTALLLCVIYRNDCHVIGRGGAQLLSLPGRDVLVAVLSLGSILNYIVLLLALHSPDCKHNIIPESQIW